MKSFSFTASDKRVEFGDCMQATKVAIAKAKDGADITKNTGETK